MEHTGLAEKVIFSLKVTKVYPFNPGVFSLYTFSKKWTHVSYENLNRDAVTHVEALAGSAAADHSNWSCLEYQTEMCFLIPNNFL